MNEMNVHTRPRFVLQILFRLPGAFRRLQKYLLVNPSIRLFLARGYSFAG